MTLLDGAAICIICRETFEFGHYYSFHVANCRTKKRTYIKMDSATKKAAVEMVEAYMRHNLPGVLIGYKE